MKLFAITERYGDRIMIRPVYYGGEALFFAGRQPANQQLILLDLPGLSQATSEAILAWLGERAKQRRGLRLPFIGRSGAERPPLNELPEEVWRPGVLDDIFEVENYHAVAWRLAQHFNLAEFSAFMERWLPEAQTRVRAALAIPAAPEQAAALNQLRPFLERLFTLLYQIPGRVSTEYNHLIYELEMAQILTLRRQGFAVTPWLNLAEKLYTPQLALDLLNEVAGYLAQPTTDPARLHQVLAIMRASAKLKQMTTHAPAFWNRLKYYLKLEPTVQGETIDLTEAKEQSVVLGWPVLEARRVGRIIPDRSALVLRDDQGRLTYIAGERKLKFQIARAGGRLQKFGNTLTLNMTGSNNLHQALLEVELLDTLANVAPHQALARLESLNLPPTHPVFEAATATETDPRQARILADLLIELVVGVDADVARRLMRAQVRGNRRR